MINGSAGAGLGVNAGKGTSPTSAGNIGGNPFALSEDGSPSTKDFVHDSVSGGLHGVGDGKPPAGGSASNQHVNENVLHSQLNAGGHLDNHAKSANGITKLPKDFQHASAAPTVKPPGDTPAKPPTGPSGVAGFLGSAAKGGATKFLEGFKSSLNPPGQSEGIAGKVGRAYKDAKAKVAAGNVEKMSLDPDTALSAFLKEYSAHAHLKNTHAINELLDHLDEPDEEEEDVEKSASDGIMR